MSRDPIVERAVETQQVPHLCLAEVQAVLKKWNCVIDPVFTFRGPMVQPDGQVRYLGPKIERTGRDR